MEVNRIKQMQRLRTSIPDMQKTLDTVKFLESKQVRATREKFTKDGNWTDCVG